MEVYALIGPSGTGKSHHCCSLAYQEGIEYIIDDGLLIKGNQILAGRSAKRENTKMAATKRAIFLDPEHALQVKGKIREACPKSILVLGTSERMIKRITERLEIPYPKKIFNIYDIASEKEIAKALESREKENRHAIPIPTFAIEKDFPGFFLDSIRAFFKGKDRGEARPHNLEHSIVRPIYSSLGNYYLHENAIEQIIVYLAGKREGITKARTTALLSTRNGMIINVQVDIQYGSFFFPRLLKEVQEDIKTGLEYLTGLQIAQVNITARRLIVPGKKKIKKN
ncbi:MAG: hypothetical protein GXZ07_09035 [Firmicutes bacterium]|nr:hypothetical protein [Bacillota bacterium]